MIILRNASEITAIRHAGQIVGETLQKLKKAAQPGVSTENLDRLAIAEILAHGGEAAFKGYRGYPAAICASINEVVVHGIPSQRILADGDILSIDVGVRYNGYCGDAAITVPIGTIDAQSQKLLEVTEASLHKGLEAIAPGKRLSEVSCAIQEHVEANGFSVVRSFVGHGIGTMLHEEPEIPNYGQHGTGPRLEQGMVLAIEPMVNGGHYAVRILDDGWTAVTKDGSRSAHFEHTVIVTDSGFEITTKA